MLISNASSPNSLCTLMLSRLCRRPACHSLHMFPIMALQSACFKQMT